ncbi:MAG: hypothetical protein RR998_09180 [Oscillospiraceae bacterium]
MKYKAPAKPKKKNTPPLARRAAPLICAFVLIALFCIYVFAAIPSQGRAFAPSIGIALASLTLGTLVIARIAFLRPAYLKKRTAAVLLAFTLGFMSLISLISALFASLEKLNPAVTFVIESFLLVLYSLLSFTVFAAARRLSPARDFTEEMPVFIRAAESEIREILTHCDNHRARELIGSVNDALLFSDPLSNFDTASCEDAIARYIYQLDDLHNYDNLAMVESVCDALHIQISRRNEICASSRELKE